MPWRDSKAEMCKHPRGKFSPISEKTNNNLMYVKNQNLFNLQHFKQKLFCGALRAYTAEQALK
jgi:hypothetical protein